MEHPGRPGRCYRAVNGICGTLHLTRSCILHKIREVGKAAYHVDSASANSSHVLGEPPLTGCQLEIDLETKKPVETPDSVHLICQFWHKTLRVYFLPALPLIRGNAVCAFGM